MSVCKHLQQKRLGRLKVHKGIHGLGCCEMQNSRTNSRFTCVSWNLQLESWIQLCRKVFVRFAFANVCNGWCPETGVGTLLATVPEGIGRPKVIIKSSSLVFRMVSWLTKHFFHRNGSTTKQLLQSLWSSWTRGSPVTTQVATLLSTHLLAASVQWRHSFENVQVRWCVRCDVAQ